MLKRILIMTTLLFLAWAAIAAEKDPADQPGAPTLSTLPAQRMLVIAAQGDPDSVAGPAFAKLFRVYYAQTKGPDKRHAPSPRARWAVSQLDAPKTSWIGAYGIPVGPLFPSEIPEGMRLETWEYGLTAQILHVGPYAGEERDIAALKDYITRNGLVISGPHEEVYVKGPGRFFKGNPDRYRTLIRYPVSRMGELPQPLAGQPMDKPAEQGIR